MDKKVFGSKHGEFGEILESFNEIFGKQIIENSIENIDILQKIDQFKVLIGIDKFLIVLQNIRKMLDKMSQEKYQDDEPVWGSGNLSIDIDSIIGTINFLDNNNNLINIIMEYVALDNIFEKYKEDIIQNITDSRSDRWDQELKKQDEENTLETKKETPEEDNNQAMSNNHDYTNKSGNPVKVAHRSTEEIIDTTFNMDINLDNENTDYHNQKNHLREIKDFCENRLAPFQRNIFLEKIKECYDQRQQENDGNEVRIIFNDNQENVLMFIWEIVRNIDFYYKGKNLQDLVDDKLISFLEDIIFDKITNLDINNNNISNIDFKSVNPQDKLKQITDKIKDSATDIQELITQIQQFEVPIQESDVQRHDPIITQRIQDLIFQIHDQLDMQTDIIGHDDYFCEYDTE